MSAVTITNDDQLHAVVGQILGFHPEDSIVIVGVGGAPTARVDAGPLAGLIEVLSPAVPHWQTVVVVGYGTGQPLVRDMAVWLESVGVQVAKAVGADNGAGLGARSDSELDARRVLASRAAMEREAAEITDPALAERMALTYYETGNGAAAWVYADRAIALLGHTTPTLEDLADRLTNAVPPC